MLIFCRIYQADRVGHCVWARVQCAGMGDMLDRAPSRKHTSKPGTLCPQKSGTHALTSGIVLGQAEQEVPESL